MAKYDDSKRIVQLEKEGRGVHPSLDEAVVNAGNCFPNDVSGVQMLAEPTKTKPTKTSGARLSWADRRDIDSAGD